MKRELLLVATVGFILTGCGENSAEVASIQENDAKQNLTEDQENESRIKEQVIEPEADEISIIMAGDVLLHDRVEDSCKDENGDYNFDVLFEHVSAEIESADIAIVNQEVIIGGKELGVTGYPAFNAPYEVADSLEKVGFDVVCHGTNHALDKGGKGIINCINYWEDNYSDVAVLGIHDSYEDQEDIYIWESEKNGVKIAFLNYTYGTNGISLPKDMPYAVDYLSEEKVIADLEKAEEMADFTVVCPHWGTEYFLSVDSTQKKWAKIFVENGADLIIGTHPHVIEPIEVIEDEKNGNSAVVYYSLGNFVNWTSGTGEGVSNRMLGGMAKVDLLCDESGVTIKNSEIIPIISHVSSGKNGVTVYKLDEYTDELACENEIKRQAPDFSLEYVQKLAKEIWE